MSELVPTVRLRWVERTVIVRTIPHEISTKRKVLQQWFSMAIPDYMRSAQDAGEWRDVQSVAE